MNAQQIIVRAVVKIMEEHVADFRSRGCICGWRLKNGRINFAIAHRDHIAHEIAVRLANNETYQEE